MLNQAMSFIRNVVLSTDASYTMRADGLDLLLQNERKMARNANFRTITIPPFTGNPLAIPLDTYNSIQSEVLAGQKIAAIKLLRACFVDYEGKSTLSLKDAKDSVESKLNFRQP